MIDATYSTVTMRDGVSLNVATWPGARTGVVAVHGISANHLAWQAVADQLDEQWQLVAMDRRGCGLSDKPTHAAAYGLQQTGDDTAEVIRSMGFEKVLLVGHSYGGYSVEQTAARHPDLVAGLLIVDGGFTMIPEGTDLEALLRIVLGPSIRRMESQWPSVEEFLAPMKAGASWRIGGEWNDYVDRYYRADIVGEPPHLMSRTSLLMLMEEFKSMAAASLHDDLEKITCPVHVMRAEYGLLVTGEEPMLLPDVYMEEMRKRVPHMTDEIVAGTNHYTITLSELGGKSVAAAINRLAPTLLV